jgi:hypothetical protein
MAGREFEKQMPTGFQDAITPKSQDRRNTFLPILLLAIFILGSFFVAWHAGVVALIARAFVYGMASRFMPDDLEYYLLRRISAMDNREADYRKNNDLMRAEAAHDMAERLKDALLLVHGQDRKVPQMREIRNM